MKRTILSPLIPLSFLSALLAILALGCLGPETATPDATPPGPPNVLIVLADDLGLGDLGCLNPESKIPTPCLDRLASEGMRLTDAHSPSAVCTPTRYGLLTGRYCWRSRMKSGVGDGYSPLLIEPGRETIASLLKRKGYRTAAVAKWHLGLGDEKPTDYSKPLRPGPCDVGFDHFFGIPASLDMAPYLYVRDDAPEVAATETIEGSRHRRQNGGGFWRKGPIAPGFRHDGVLDRFVDEASSFLEEHGREHADEPFFLYLALSAPHTPWVPTAPFQGQTEIGWYGDFVAQVDAAIRSVLDALEGAGLAENTLVIVTSDNGSHWPVSDIERWGHRANGPYRGQKADIWEGGHRVPLLVRWPGKVAPGSVDEETVCLTDLMATIAGIAGVEMPEGAGEDSEDLRPVLLGHRREGPLREAVVHHSHAGTFAIRQGHWKLIEGLGSGGFTAPRMVKPEPGGPTGRLFDLEADPGETRDLWSEHPEVVARLAALLEKYRERGHSHAD